MDKLTETINKVFEDAEIKNLISDEIERISECKAKEKATEYINILEKEANEYLDKKVSRIVEHVSEILEETVKMFTEKYKAEIDCHKADVKSHAILEALTTMCTIAGVSAETITKEANNISTKNEKMLESKISCLKKLLAEEQDNSKILEKRKCKEIDELRESMTEKCEEIERLNDVIHEKELKNIQLSDKNDELENKLDTNETEMQRLNDKIKEIELENDQITEEKNNIAKLGIIAELKQDLSLSESREFEKNAINIPFSMDKSYIDKLTTLKDSIVENQLNEVTTKEESNEVQKWYDKYI